MVNQTPNHNQVSHSRNTLGHPQRSKCSLLLTQSPVLKALGAAVASMAVEVGAAV